MVQAERRSDETARANLGLVHILASFRSNDREIAGIIDALYVLGAAVVAFIVGALDDCLVPAHENDVAVRALECCDRFLWETLRPATSEK